MIPYILTSIKNQFLTTTKKNTFKAINTPSYRPWEPQKYKKKLRKNLSQNLITKNLLANTMARPNGI